jgi:hypothetical protein
VIHVFIERHHNPQSGGKERIMHVSIGLAPGAAALLACAGAVQSTLAQTVTESFESGFRAWSPHGIVYCAPDCTLDYAIELSQEQAHEGDWSVEMMGVGYLDSGVIFVQRPIVLQPGTWTPTVEFQIYSIAGGEVGSWDAAAYIGLEPPDEEFEFTMIGPISLQGWNTFSLEQTIEVDEPTTVYVAVGYRINFEVENTHWVDSVVISGIPGQVAADLNFDGEVGAADLAELLAQWGACPPPQKGSCLADLEPADGDGEVGAADLGELLANWSR